MNPEPLEKKFLFRLLKVTYTLGLILGFLIVCLGAWESRPTKYIDDSKTTVNCPNGKSYTTGSLNMWLVEQEVKLDTYDDKKAKIACIYGEKEDYLKDYKLPSKVDYTVTYITSTSGDWGSVALWLIIGSVAVYTILNLLRETLNYIFFGRHFQWDWLSKLVALFRTESDKE